MAKLPTAKSAYRCDSIKIFYLTNSQRLSLEHTVAPFLYCKKKRRENKYQFDRHAKKRTHRNTKYMICAIHAVLVILKIETIFERSIKIDK